MRPLLFVVVVTTVVLHHQSCLQAGEVCNKRTERLLPPKLVPAELPGAKRAPQCPLSIGRIMS